jgi:hypothetical protein
VAQRMLNTSISSLLNSLDGRCEEVPTIIQQLCGRTFIFQLKLNIENLTQGKSNYIVRRTFVPDDKLEMQHLDDKAKVSVHFLCIKSNINDFVSITIF